MASVIRGSGTSSLGGDLDIEGVLTYEDVSSVDSVGVITARSGIDVGTGTSISTPADNILALGTNSETRLRITSGGFVGIGTNISPRQRLDVQGGSDATVCVFGEPLSASGQIQTDSTIHLTGNHSDGDGPSITFSEQNVTSASATGRGARITAIRVARASHRKMSLRLSAADSDGVSRQGINVRDDRITFDTSQEEAARFDSSQRLLVGLSTFTGEATAVLEGSSAGETTQAQLWLNRGSTPVTDNVLGQIIFGDNTESGRNGAMIQCKADDNWAADDYPSRLMFLTTADGASSPTERLRIQADGDYHLGNETNYAYIRPYESSTGNLIIGADQSTTGTDGSAIIFRTRGSEKIRLENGGHLLGTAGARIVQEVFKAEWSGTPDAAIYELDIDNFTNSGTSVFYYFRINAWEDIANMNGMISYDVWIHKRAATSVSVNIVNLTGWSAKALGFYHYTADSGTGDKRFVVYFGEDYSGFSVIDYTSDTGRMKSTKGHWSQTLTNSDATTAIAGYTAVTPYVYSYT